jgi:hypothetical protein
MSGQGCGRTRRIARGPTFAQRLPPSTFTHLLTIACICWEGLRCQSPCRAPWWLSRPPWRSRDSVSRPSCQLRRQAIRGVDTLEQGRWRPAPAVDEHRRLTSISRTGMQVYCNIGGRPMQRGSNGVAGCSSVSIEDHGMVMSLAVGIQPRRPRGGVRGRVGSLCGTRRDGRSWAPLPSGAACVVPEPIPQRKGATSDV